MKKQDPIESLLGRLDELDTANLHSLINRLARDRRLLNAVFTTLREGVIVVKTDGMIDYANPAACEMLGLRETNLATTSLWKVLPDFARSLKLTRSGHLLEAVGTSRELFLTYPERRTVRLYMVPFEEDVDGSEILRHAVILSDITQDKNQTEREIESERVNSILQLAAGVAHELGNPLNSLTIHLQVLERRLAKLEGGGNDKKLKEILGICRGEVDRLDSIITHFLEAVRPSDPDLHDLDLLSPLEESIEFLGPELESAGIQVDLQLDSDVPVISGDRNQIKQVFFNLLKNARQAIQSGGIIRVRAFSDDDSVYIQVGDTGTGISESDLPKVFQPYFSRKKEGHGLGMMIVERILRDHGGSIGLDSREGIGTVVTLQFPQKNRRIRLLED